MKVITENLKFINEYPDKASELAKRLHVKKDEIPFVRKYYTSEKQEADKKKRSVISYISTGALDRDGEKLLPEGVNLENYKKNPVVMLGHDYKSLPVGKNIWIKKDDKGLVAKTVFAKSERGDEIYRACTEDIEGTGPLLQGWSVGFIPIEWEDIETKDKKEKPGRIYNKWELLEYSIVPIPSCPEALTLAMEKGLISDRLKKDLEIEVVKDREIIVEKEDKEIEVVKDDENPFPIGHDEFGEIKTHGKEIITKPETTEQYHRIPVSTGHDGHRIRTITISASQGIKALYCGTCKKVITYLFDVKKWTMEEAKKWIAEHKDFNDIETKADTEEVTEEIVEEKETESNEKEVDENRIELVEDENEVAEKEKETGRTWDELDAEEKKYISKTGKRLPIETTDYTNLEVAIKDLTTQVVELKEGRILSTKNRTLVKDTIEALATLKERLDELYTATEPSKGEEKQKYNCECIKCGYKMTSDEHCDKLKCPECGGEMRRLERPGPGKEVGLEIIKSEPSTTNAIEALFSSGKFAEMIDKAMKEAFDINIKKKLGRVE